MQKQQHLLVQGELSDCYAIAIASKAWLDLPRVCLTNLQV